MRDACPSLTSLAGIAYPANPLRFVRFLLRSYFITYLLTPDNSSVLRLNRSLHRLMIKRGTQVVISVGAGCSQAFGNRLAL